MRHASLRDYLNDKPGFRPIGPVAMVFIEDTAEISSTVQHHKSLGFSDILVLAPARMPLPRDVTETAICIGHDTHSPDAVMDAVNNVVAAVPGIWLYYCFNAEYLYFPFCETRSISEMLAFHEEERREAMVSFVVDLYASDLRAAPNAVDRISAKFDQTGYFALGRGNGSIGPKERQLDFFGGLKWRFEEFVPTERRKIDRISLFKTKPGLQLRADFTLSDEEMNTYACPWHNNLTCAVASFRTAKALCTNPESRPAIKDFNWARSVGFNWNSQQLMDLGFMEPGQWF